MRSNSSLVTRAFQDHRRVKGKGATALLASRSPLIDRAVPTLASSRTLSVHASNPQSRARAQMDANRVNRNIAFDSDRLHWEHANASFTACSCERHVPPRLRRMKPRVRRGLVGLKDNRTSRRMVCRARNSVRCASMILLAGPPPESWSCALGKPFYATFCCP